MGVERTKKQILRLTRIPSFSHLAEGNGKDISFITEQNRLPYRVWFCISFSIFLLLFFFLWKKNKTSKKIVVFNAENAKEISTEFFYVEWILISLVFPVAVRYFRVCTRDSRIF